MFQWFLPCHGLWIDVKVYFHGCLTGSWIDMFIAQFLMLSLTPRFVNVSSADISVRLRYDVSSYNTTDSTHKLQYLYIVSFSFSHPHPILIPSSSHLITKYYSPP